MTTVWRIFRYLSIVLLSYLALGVQTVKAQVQLPPLVKSQWLDQNGRPLANGCIFTYISGTNTPQATFTDFTGGTPNPNPIVLDGSGRAPLGTDIWLGSGSYRLKLVSQGGVNCVSGVQQWVEDGITTAFGTILASNNTWTGTNTFNGPTVFNGSVTMNVGFTSNGPSNLTAGGSMAGTFSGSPIFSGTPNFSGGLMATTGTFSGQITSTVTTGTAPFVINSTTQVNNLNAQLLNGCTWAIPCVIGSTTPNQAAFTDLTANTEFVLNGSTPLTSVQGTDVKIMTAGTVSGAAGTQLCIDANGGATTTACTGGGFSRISTGTNNSVCSTTNVNGDTCTTVVTITPTQADTSYVASCSGQTPTQYPFIIGVNNTSTSSITVTITNGAAAQAQISTYASLNCIAVHP